uniref:RAN binding protein 17 n=1 Tax=Phasianus colchicus TaxID=9054 RepID=A0A669PS72_PHACC
MDTHVSNLAKLEVLSSHLYEGTDLAQQTRAENMVLELINSPDCLSQCQLLLEQRMVSIRTMYLLLISESFFFFFFPGNYLLNYVTSQPKAAPFVTQALVDVIAKIIKLGWLTMKFEQYIYHCMIGIMTLRTDLGNKSSKHVSFLVQGVYVLLMKQHVRSLHLLKLVLNCLNFDFIGNSANESADDLHTVQIAGSWKRIFLEPETSDLFFDLYHCLPPMLSQLVLSCLVQFASTRRSLFSNPEHARYFGTLIKGAKQILENPRVSVCLFVILESYQLGELVTDYPEVIQPIANSTITGLRHWDSAPNSIHYLLTLWQRMVASVTFVKTAEPHLLDRYAAEITEAYVTSRLERVPVVVRDGLEDPLDVSRCGCEKTCTLLGQLFDQNAQNYQKLFCSSSRNQLEITVQEGRLAWLVYFVGIFVGGILMHTITDEHDAMDGELSCWVFQLMPFLDAQLPQASNEKVELAILWFLDQFHKTYVGEQPQHTSKVTSALKKGGNRVIKSLFFPICSSVTNLKYRGRCEPVISRTLQFLNDLSVEYPFLVLVKTDAVKFMLQNHTRKHFPFLGFSDNYSISDLQCQTMFYAALTHLLMVNLGEDENEFKNFMLLLTVSFECDSDRMLIGLARDLRGIAFALNTKTSYTMLFDWIYPTYISVLQKAIELWCQEPACATPILKLMAEFMQNRSRRLNFDGSSPNGILLFREASEMICTHIGFNACFVVLELVQMSIFIINIYYFHFQQYRKLSQSYYPLLECLTQDHMDFITSLEPHVLVCILTSISGGLTALGKSCSHTAEEEICCVSLDYIVTYLFKLLGYRAHPGNLRMISKALLIFPDRQTVGIFFQMMLIPMNTIVFEDCRNQQSVSGPLLGLLNEKYFSELRATLINSQPGSKRQVLEQCFRNLMKGVEQNLSVENRDWQRKKDLEVNTEKHRSHPWQ